MDAGLDRSPALSELLAHADWVRALARELVRDEARAEDVVQETWLAALRRPPAAGTNARGWLAAVARNAARALGRGERRRESRERAAARPEALPSAAELAALAASQRDLVDRVLALDEPYREVLLLRYFAGLAPSAIAARLGVPLATVRTRHARALERLRARLAREHGERSAWSAALAPLLAVDAAPVPGLVAGAAGALALAAAAVGLWFAAPPDGEDAGRRAASTALAAIDPGGEQDARQRAVGDASPEVREVASAALVDVPRAAGSPERAPRPVRARVVDADGRAVAGAVLKHLPGAFAVATFDELARRKAALAASPDPERALELERARRAIEAAPTSIAEADGSLELDPPSDPREWRAWQAGLVLVGAGWRREGPESDGEGELVIVAARTTTLAGSVVDRAGAPVDRAYVRGSTSLRSVIDGLGLPWTLEGSVDAADDVAALSDANGRFTLHDVPSLAALRLGAVRDQARSAMLAPFGDGTPGAIELVLVEDAEAYPAELCVSGVVVDAAARPVGGAHVRLAERATTSANDGTFRLELGRASSTEALVGSWTNRARSAPLIAIGGAAQPAVIEGYSARIAEPGEREGVVLRLGPPALAIAGRVVDGIGRPRPCVEVAVLDGLATGMSAWTAEGLARGLAGGNGGRGGRGTQETVLSQGDGSFAIAGLGERSYRLIAIDADRRVVVETAPIAAGAADVRIEAAGDLRERVRGRVRTRDGRPVAGVDVALQLGYAPGRGTPFLREVERTVTDRGGRFELERVPRSRACFDVDGEDVGREWVDVAEVREGEELSIEVVRTARFRVDLRPGDAADAFGVLDRDGNELAIDPPRASGRGRGKRLPLERGTSGPCRVDDRAATLVLHRGASELRRIALELRPGELEVVVP